MYILKTPINRQEFIRVVIRVSFYLDSTVTHLNKGHLGNIESVLYS